MRDARLAELAASGYGVTSGESRECDWNAPEITDFED
jgi:hypothetical protein